jgi:hypothetical protein
MPAVRVSTRIVRGSTRRKLNNGRQYAFFLVLFLGAVLFGALLARRV